MVNVNHWLECKLPEMPCYMERHSRNPRYLLDQFLLAGRRRKFVGMPRSTQLYLGRGCEESEFTEKFRDKFRVRNPGGKEDPPFCAEL